MSVNDSLLLYNSGVLRHHKAVNICCRKQSHRAVGISISASHSIASDTHKQALHACGSDSYQMPSYMIMDCCRQPSLHFQPANLCSEQTFWVFL